MQYDNNIFKWVKRITPLPKYLIKSQLSSLKSSSQLVVRTLMGSLRANFKILHDCSSILVQIYAWSTHVFSFQNSVYNILPWGFIISQFIRYIFYTSFSVMGPIFISRSISASSMSGGIGGSRRFIIFSKCSRYLSSFAISSVIAEHSSAFTGRYWLGPWPSLSFFVI